MKGLYALEGGLAGAVALTLIHETLKRTFPQAPRMDLLGMNALAKGLHLMKVKTPDERKLYNLTLAGDLVSNTLYYSVAGITKKAHPLVRGSMLGLAAGLGAILLPKPMHLNSSYSARTTQTKIMTIGLYVIGGLVASAVMMAIDRKKQKHNEKWQHRLVTSSQA